MAKPTDPCNSNNVPDETIIDQVQQLDNMLYECGSKGGSLQIRVLYGCGDGTPGKDKRLGDSTKINWPPAGAPTTPVGGGGLEVGGPRSDESNAYLAEQLRELMEQAELKSTGKCPDGTDNAFVVQGFCTGKDGRAIRRPGVPNEYNPPFMPTIPPKD